LCICMYMDTNSILVIVLIVLIFVLLGRAVKAIENCKIRKALEEYDRRVKQREQGKAQREEEHRRAREQCKCSRQNISVS